MQFIITTTNKNRHSMYHMLIHSQMINVDQQSNPRQSVYKYTQCNYFRAAGTGISVIYISDGDLGYQISTASHCGDSTTEDVARRCLESQGLQLSIILTAKKKDQEGEKGVNLFCPTSLHLLIVSG